MMEIRHGRVALWLRTLREGEGTALLCLHELGGSGEDFEALAPAWSGPVHALDFSGHGLSGRVGGGAYMSELLAGDADVALQRIGPCVLFGRGLGAYVALLLAGGRPDAVPAALLAPGRGIEGVEAPDFDRIPDTALPPAVDAEPSEVREEPAFDPRAGEHLRRELRPSDYAEPFARAAKRLWLVDDELQPPGWWRRCSEQENAKRLVGVGEVGALDELARQLRV